MEEMRETKRHLPDKNEQQQRIARLKASISRQRRVQEELLLERNRLLSIVNTMDDGVYIVDGRYELEYVNPTLLKEFGAVEGRKCYSFFHERQDPCPWCKNQDVLKGKTVHWEWHDPKTKKTYDVIDKPIKNPDGSISKLEVMRDITGQKKAEEERHKLEKKMYEAQRLESIGVLAGGIAHDFNNMLTSVLGHADLALWELTSESPVSSHVKEMKTAAICLAELTNQLLAYSGKGKYRIEAINLTALVEQIVDLLRISISKKVSIKYDLLPDLAMVKGDSSQLRQVIMNLMTNASEAIGDKSGVIRICTGVVKGDRKLFSETLPNQDLPEGYYVYVEVSDTGCGMDQETIDKIFDPFFSTKFTGRGLGLAAVLGIVGSHGGAIKVRSEPNRGATFTVLLPRTEDAGPPDSEAQESKESACGRGTILVVDDEKAVRAMAKKILEKAGFEVLTASQGREGVQVLRENAKSVSAVLLDLTMPRMDGIEALREMRRIRTDIPIILSSGYNEDYARSLFGANDLADFIQKPYEAQSLIRKLRQLLEG